MIVKMEIIPSGNKMGLKNVYIHREPDRHGQGKHLAMALRLW